MSTFNDGGVPFGVRKVKFYPSGAPDVNGNTTWTGAAKGIYILESFTVTRPTRGARRYDEGGVPNGAFAVDDFAEATAVVQLQYNATVRIATSDAFCTALPDSPGGTAEGFVVTNAEAPEEQIGIRKQSIRLQKIVSATPPTAYP